MKIKKWELPDTNIFWDEYDKHYIETNGESYNKTFRISKMLLVIDIITNDNDGLICFSSIRHIDSKKELFKVTDFISRLDKTDRLNWYILMKEWANNSLEKYIMSFCERENK